MLASWFPGSDCQLLPHFYGGSVSWERCQVPRLTACAYSADAWPKVTQSGYGGIKQLSQLLQTYDHTMSNGYFTLSVP